MTLCLQLKNNKNNNNDTDDDDDNDDDDDDHHHQHYKHGYCFVKCSAILRQCTINTLHGTFHHCIVYLNKPFIVCHPGLDRNVLGLRL